MDQKKPTMETRQKPPPHVAMIPTPGMGHLIPLVELAKRLVLHHNFQVTIIIPNDGSPMKPHKQLLQSLPKSIASIFLPPVSFQDLPEDVKIETRITLSLTRSLHFLRDSLKVLTESTHLVALVFDVFGSIAFDVAKELGFHPYIFLPISAMMLSLIFHLPELDKKFTCEFRDVPEPIQLPGCIPVHGSDLPDPVQERNNEAYKFVFYIAKLYPSSAGIIINSFIDLEPGPFKSLMENQSDNRCPVYPVGPLIQTGSDNNVADHDCLKWLDKQPSGSVLFISFGSGGTLSQEQLNELAAGLEMSGQRFIWVVRSPNEKATNASYFTVESSNDNDPFDFLPTGFLDRTKEKGLVVSSWAPQIQVLSHGSTSGFLSHCGWNSTLESIVHGVPMIAWPLYAEQKMNAVLLAEDLKVAWRVKVSGNGLVGRDDIVKYVKGLIEGEDGKLLKKKMSELKDAAATVLSGDGSSTKTLAKVAEIWKNQK